MNNILSKIFCFVLVGSLMSCTSKKNDIPNDGINKISSSTIENDKTLTPEEKAEKMALAGEQLNTPTGFMYADMLFDQALTLDPQNKRAQYYKAFLSTKMALRGILTRIMPLIESNPKSKKEYYEMLAKLPNSGLRTFLLDGKPDIKNEKDVQMFLASIYDGLDQFREFLKQNKSLELTLNLNDWEKSANIQKLIEDCPATQISKDEYDVQNCSLIHALEIKLNRADFETLQHFTAGLELYFTYFIAYDLSDITKVSKMHEGRKTSSRTIYAELAKNPDFGKLINKKALQNIPNMGIDLLAGYRWALQIQDELCPNNEISKNNRKGYLFENGLCLNNVDDNGNPIEESLKAIDLVLEGQAMDITLGAKNEYKTKYAPMAIYNNPIEDFKTLNPVFNNCDNIQATSDDTLGGLFPNRDANYVLGLKSNCEK